MAYPGAGDEQTETGGGPATEIRNELGEGQHAFDTETEGAQDLDKDGKLAEGEVQNGDRGREGENKVQVVEVMLPIPDPAKTATQTTAVRVLVVVAVLAVVQEALVVFVVVDGRGRKGFADIGVQGHRAWIMAIAYDDFEQHQLR